jgi:hypothetical protein
MKLELSGADVERVLKDYIGTRVTSELGALTMKAKSGFNRLDSVAFELKIEVRSALLTAVLLSHANRLFPDRFTRIEVKAGYNEIESVLFLEAEPPEFEPPEIVDTLVGAPLDEMRVLKPPEGPDL